MSTETHSAPSVSDVIALCGGNLGENPSPEAVESFLCALAARASESEPIRREVLRSEAIQTLKTAKTPGATSLVKAAFGSPEPEKGADDAGQGRAILVADPEPWPDSVDGAELLNTLARTFARFVVMPEGAATALSLWVLVTYTYPAFFILPLLNITSPVKGCGKTTLLDLLGYLVSRPFRADNITPGALYRFVEMQRPTLLLDETDAWMDDKEELRGIVNAGYTRSGSVIRCVGDNLEARAFSAWCPKAIAGIRDRAGTVMDRSITVELQRAAPGERKERLRRDRMEGGELESLRQQAARWAADHLSSLEDADPEVPTDLYDRPADNWRALLAIAEAAGGDWPERARRAALVLSGAASVDAREDDPGVRLLADIRAFFDEHGPGPHASQEVADALATMEDRPWSEWRHGKPITPNAIARLLKRFKIHPTQHRRGPASEEKIRGYTLEQFARSFSQYLGSTEPVQAVQSSNGADFRPSGNRYKVEDRTGSGNGKNPHRSYDVPLVPVHTGAPACEVLEL